MESNVTSLYVFQSLANQQWYWRAEAENNEIVATSEGYTREADARRAAESVFPGIEIHQAKAR